MAVNLTWAAPLVGIPDSYTVTVTPGDAITVPGTQTALAVTGLRNGTEYAFTITARTAAGTGPGSAAVTATPRTDQPGKIEALIVQYEPGVRPVTSNGEVTGESVVQEMDLKIGAPIGFGMRTVELAQPVTAAAAARIASQLETSGTVRVAEPDLPVSLFNTQESPPWGLDRIDQRDVPGNNRYTYSSTGQGVTAYIVDTGIRASHMDFGGRVRPGHNTTGGPESDWNDCHGHGTHVAGTVGGSTYGVAKAVTLIPVRVLNCRGSGTWSGVIAGLSWIVDHHQSGTPAVANMSLGGFAVSLVDEAVRAVVNDGVTVVVASGNSRDDACLYSPARERSAITVNASDGFDWRASFSNYGGCTDIYAPGVSILSATHQTDTSSASWSGTSMAAPHVAGVAARILSVEPNLSPQQVWERIASTATPHNFSSFANDPNLLLFAGAESPPEGAVPGPPTGLTLGGGHLFAEARWVAPTTIGTSPLLGYRVSAFSAATGGREVAGCSTGAPLPLTCRVNNLVGGQTYFFEVRASNVSGPGAPSSPRIAYTVTRMTPSAPTGVSASVVGAEVRIHWQRPTEDGDSSITAYHARIFTGAAGGLPVFTCTAQAPATNCTVTLPDTSARTMHIDVVAVNATNGSGDPSSPRVRVDMSGMPNAPRNVIVTPSTVAARVAWQPPEWSGGLNLTYDVQAFTSATGSTVVSTCSSTITTCDLTRLSPGIQYWVTVNARSGTLRGPGTPRLAFTTLPVVPAAPVLVSAVPGDGVITATWREPVNGGSPITGYVATARGFGSASDVTCQTAVLSCQLIGLTNGVEYSVIVVAVNSVGAGLPSSSLRARPAGRSGPPTAVSLASARWDELTVSFRRPESDGGSRILSYRARLFTSSTTSGPLKTCTAPPGTNNCRFTGLTAATTYVVDVLAITGAGEGLPSDRVTGATSGTTVPSSPTTVSALSLPDGTVRIGWRPPADSGGSPVTRVVVGAFTNATGDAPVAQCEGTSAGIGGSCSITAIPVPLGTRVWIEAWAFNSVGSSVWSGSRPSVVVATAPSAPRDVTAEPAAQVINARWQSPDSTGGRPIATYDVIVTDGAGRRITACQTASLVCTMSSSSLRPGTSYTLTVAANNAVGTGPASNPITVTMPPASSPGSPTNVAVFRAGPGAAWVSFNRGSDGGLPTTFTARAFTAPSGGSQVATCSAGSSTSCRLSVRVGTTIWVQVEASNAVGTTTSARVGYVVR